MTAPGNEGLPTMLEEAVLPEITEQSSAVAAWCSWVNRPIRR